MFERVGGQLLAGFHRSVALGVCKLSIILGDFLVRGFYSKEPNPPKSLRGVCNSESIYQPHAQNQRD